MAERLAPFRADIAAATATHPDPLEVGILLWRAMHHHIGLLRRDHPDWIFVRHEDLSQAPVPGFEALYARLGLGFGPEVAARIEAMSGGDGGLAALSIFGTRRRTVRDSRAAASYFHKRLSEAQIARIREAADDVWPEFYGPEDW